MTNGTVVASALPDSSFIPRSGATNCEDPNTDDVYSLGGQLTQGTTFVTTNDVWFSDHGLEWFKSATSYSPGRYYSSCDVNALGQLLMIGGIDANRLLLNDVWISQSNSWKQQTARAPWSGRGEHLVLIAQNPILNVELIYVMGGFIVYSDTQGNNREANDVWVSSDEGITWSRVTANAPWSTRWGHGGVVTSGGVLLVIGGTHNEPSANFVVCNDIWASFDGGVSWGRCNTPTPTAFVRGEMGVALNDYEELLLSSGYAFNGVSRTDFRDVWKSTFSLQDPDTLIPMCNGYTPPLGVGLQAWPKAPPPVSSSSSTAAPRSSSSSSTSSVRSSSSSTSSVRANSSSSSSSGRSSSSSSSSSSVRSSSSSSSSSSTGGGGGLRTVFTFTRVTANAPWSPRIQPGFLPMNTALTFRSTTGAATTLTPPWFIFYEGPLGYGQRVETENDVWATTNDGATFSLMAGISRFGLSRPNAVLSALPNTSFISRAGSTNCEDPTSDRVYSIGGQYAGMQTYSNDVWYSEQGLYWNVTQSPFAARFFASCDVNSQRHLLLVAGYGGVEGGDSFLNDVWAMDTDFTWTQLSAFAPWLPRYEHIVFVGNAPRLGNAELVYVIGGMYEDSDSGLTTFLNDVWVSSDEGRTWAVVTAAAPFGGRWGAGGVITAAGVLLVGGGAATPTGAYEDTFTYRDMWASFDGGVTWSSCTLPTPATARLFVRAEQSMTLDNSERLFLVSGYEYYPGDDHKDYNDVWRADFPMSDTVTLARVCNAQVPSAGIGLQSWPGGGVTPPRPSSSSTGGGGGGSGGGGGGVPTTQFSPTLMTEKAPWSARIQPALLPMSNPITYQQVPGGQFVTTPPNWLLLYEGSLASSDDNGIRNENDVWASTDGGASWNLISGVSWLGATGFTLSALPNASFAARAGSDNCEDPTSDTVYSIGGLAQRSDRNIVSTNDVWSSEDGLLWTKYPGATFSPPRYFSSCDVNSLKRLLVVGGIQSFAPNGLLNDVWLMASGAWFRVTDKAPWHARGEHSVVIGTAHLLGAELVYVMGGYASVDGNGNTVQSNDVWASSDQGSTWAQITARAPWGPRWGHGSVITAAGVLLVIGGANNDLPTSPTYSWKDVWASYDGGVSWTQCAVRDGATNAFIRTEQAVALNDQEELLLASGYLFDGGSRMDFSDVWKTAFSLADPQTILSMCGGTIPMAGVGLSRWPGLTPVGPTVPSSSGGADQPSGDESSGGGGLSGGAVFGVVFVVLLVVLGASAGGYYLYRKRVMGRGGGGDGLDLGGGLDAGFGPRFGGLSGFGSAAGGGGFGESPLMGGGVSSSDNYMEMGSKSTLPGARQWTSD